MNNKLLTLKYRSYTALRLTTVMLCYTTLCNEQQIIDVKIRILCTMVYLVFLRSIVLNVWLVWEKGASLYLVLLHRKFCCVIPGVDFANFLCTALRLLKLVKFLAECTVGSLFYKCHFLRICVKGLVKSISPTFY